MSCNDIPSLLDLQKAKLNADDFGRLMGTGTGTSTNEVTGQVRPTYNAVMANLGYTRVGTFAAGGTLLNGRQTLLWGIADGGDGQEYGWSGTFLPSGKVVPPGSTPLTTGGIAVGAWMSRFDPELRIIVRENLRRSYAEAGYNLVDGSFDAGGTVTTSIDVLLYESEGKAYSYIGALPHTVEDMSNPSAEPGMWIDRSAIGQLASQSANVAVMKAASFYKPGDIIITREYHAGTERGGATYDVYPAGTAADNIVDHGLSNGAVAVLRWSTCLEIDQCGARPNDLTADFSASFSAAQAKIDAVYPCGFVVFGKGVYRFTSPIRVKEGVKLKGAGNAGFKISQNPATHLGTTATILYADIATYESWAITTDNRVVAGGAPVPYDKIINFTENDAGTYTSCNNVELCDLTLITDKPLYGGINLQMSPNSKTSSVSVVGPDIGVQRNCCWGYSDVQLFVVANYVALARAWCNGGSSSGYLTVYAQNGAVTKVFHRNYPFADIANAGTVAYPLAAAKATTCDYIANSGCEGSDNLILEHAEYPAQYIKSTVSYSGQVERTLNQNGFLCDDTNLNITRLGVFQVVPLSNIQKSYVICPGVVTSGDIWRTVDAISIVHILNHIGYGNRQQPHNSVFLSGMPSGRMGFTPISNLLSNTEAKAALTGWTGDGVRVAGVASYGTGISLPINAATKTATQVVALTVPNSAPMVLSAFVDTSGLTGGTVSLIIALHKAGAFIGNQVVNAPVGVAMKRYQVGIESFGDADEIRCSFSSSGTTGTFSAVATKFQLERAAGPSFLIASEYRGNP